ncbi:TWiK family of potassium channels protein 18-like [Watersipora subatra]|uniref:TWiK family of potassium channels protein 18-like n=1 Tax=Watersipora subatra TaxID=2589382 RepID=UPI00355B3435
MSTQEAREIHSQKKSKTKSSRQCASDTPSKREVKESAVDQKIKDGKKSKIKRFIRVVKVVLKIVLLTLVNMVVLMLGAYVFFKLESYNEIESCLAAQVDYETSLNTTIRLMKLDAEVLHAKGIDTDSVTYLEESYSDYIKSFALEVQKVQKAGYNPSHDCQMLGNDADWTNSNSIVFALTIITTIGYGVISPATTYGRLICIVYAFVGIPVYMVALATIGDLLAQLFQKFYWVVCVCGFRKPKTDTRTAAKAEQGGKKRGKLHVKKESTDEDDEKTGEVDSAAKNYDASNVTIPLTLTILLLFGMVVLGAVIFMALESWNFQEAIYFSFTTISTIGFGDVVPNIDLMASSGKVKLVTMILYITIGMATISMCFQLMVDEIYAKVDWLTSKCGVHSSETENEEELLEPPKLQRSLTKATIVMRSGTPARLRKRANP